MSDDAELIENDNKTSIPLTKSMRNELKLFSRGTEGYTEVIRRLLDIAKRYNKIIGAVSYIAKENPVDGLEETKNE